MTIERRNLLEEVEVRAEGKDLVAVGYAYRFNRYSQNLGGFVEQIAPGAGKKSIGEHDIRALFNHDPNLVLGRNKAGTLTLEENTRGGKYEIRLPDTATGREVATLLERGDVSGSSFGFRLIEDDWGDTEEGFPLRTLREFSLHDVGPVTFPAYPDTDSALRSLAESRSVDFETIRAAAEANELAAALHSSNEGGSHDTEDKPEDIHFPRSRRVI